MGRVRISFISNKHYFLALCTRDYDFTNSFTLIISGKSLLCKEGAIRMTNRLGHTRNVYFISFLAANKFGKYLNQFFTFDEASKLDLKDTNVIVLDVHQILSRYRQRHPEMSKRALKNVNVYEMLIDLIESDPTGSYFLDEVPFIASSRRLYEFGGKIMK